MNNGDMPAMAQSGASNTECDSDDFGGRGLTKREHFAGLAPEMPNWFKSTQPKIESDSPLAICHYKETLYFKWRTHYADALLKALEAKA